MLSILIWFGEQLASLFWRRWLSPDPVKTAHDIEDKNTLLPDGAAADKLHSDWQRD